MHISFKLLWVNYLNIYIPYILIPFEYSLDDQLCSFS